MLLLYKAPHPRTGLYLAEWLLCLLFVSDRVPAAEADRGDGGQLDRGKI